MSEEDKSFDTFLVVDITFGTSMPVCTLDAESFAKAQEKLFAFADDEDEFAYFYNTINRNHVCSNPYASALEDGAFLSSTNESNTTEAKARASRLAYIKKHYRVENLSLPSF